MNQKIPKQIILESTSRCNLRCRYCPSLSAPKADMSWELFKSIVDRVDFPTTLIPWMNGEPLLLDDYAQRIEYISIQGIPQYVTTNGMIWNEDFFQHITGPDSTCYQLIFSLDGLPSEESSSIEKARPGSHRDVILGNIDRLLELKKSKASGLNVATKICQRGQDWEEIERYVSYWLQRGVDYVCVGKDLTDDMTPGMRFAPCQYPDSNFMVIRADGRLVLCAYNDRIVNKDAYPLGYVREDSESILDIYNNSTYTRFREDQNLGHYNEVCRSCGFAYTGSGFTGQVRFRDKSLIQAPIFYHRDYYNEFFSLRESLKPATYYGHRR